MSADMRSPEPPYRTRYENGDVSPRHSALPKYHSVKAVAEALDVSPRTIKRWIQDGKLVVQSERCYPCNVPKNCIWPEDDRARWEVVLK